MPIEIPSKLYIDKLLKHSRSLSPKVARLSGTAKAAALHAMAERITADESAILEANAKDIEALGKSLDSADARNRMKAAVARVRVTADHIKEMADRLHLIADLPDPVGLVTSRQERPDGLQVS
ncbi:MAG: glutamate-5-semialdehyde dehydrogenase, partial [Nitrospira sp.]|nr:glutamate-5-semialdehyde dehydrogenase [Nitrospira sp.]